MLKLNLTCKCLGTFKIKIYSHHSNNVIFLECAIYLDFIFILRKEEIVNPVEWVFFFGSMDKPLSVVQYFKVMHKL